MNTQLARNLRSNLTDAEKHLWGKLRGRQIAGIKFRRQCPVGEYIVDFVSFDAMLVIEVDGSQHHQPENIDSDKQRDTHLASHGLRVLRFDNLQVLKETDAVLNMIDSTVKQQLAGAAERKPLP
jgi:very-short-patch-repair endonuclease